MHMNDIQIYEANGQQVTVRLDGETVWLSQEQMAALFERERSVITKHLRNVFREAELDEEAVCANFAHTASDGKTYQTRFFNLDAIISVGYRVNSKRGVQFRQWATRTLREHLTQGYSLNAARLAERGIDEARQAIELLARTLSDPQLISDTGREIIGLIASYAKTWHLLLKYDEDALQLPIHCQPARGILDYTTARRALDDLRASLHACGEATELFALERGEGLHGILGSIEQTMFGEPLYKSREEKAAHLFYFVVKDHPFADGNKRSAAFLLLVYLRQEQMPCAINPAALTALTLLVAESQPQNKDLMIRLIANLLLASGPQT